MDLVSGSIFYHKPSQSTFVFAEFIDSSHSSLLLLDTDMKLFIITSSEIPHKLVWPEVLSLIAASTKDVKAINPKTDRTYHWKRLC
jgi:hypothetical protein